MKWRTYLRYTAILVNGLLIIFLLGNGGGFWAMGASGVPIIVPPMLAVVALIVSPVHATDVHADASTSDAAADGVARQLGASVTNDGSSTRSNG